MSEGLREKIARAMVREVERQTGGDWPMMSILGDLSGMVDDEIDFDALSGVALALFSDELDKVVDLDDLNDLHGKIGDK